MLLCINTGKFRTDTNRMRMETNQFHLRTADEMYAAFPGFEEALKQSQLIADRVNMTVSGVGEKLSPPVELPKIAAVLVNPGVALATRDVFAKYSAAPSSSKPLAHPPQ